MLKLKPLYIDPDNYARQQAEEWRATRPAEAAQLDLIAQQPQAMWLKNEETLADFGRRAGEIAASGGIPVLVAYYIPQRDMGQWSAGGAPNQDAYVDWINRLAAVLTRVTAAVVVEPDALAHVADPEDALGRSRRGLIRYAVERLRAAGAGVYIDAGHPNWRRPEQMAARLRGAGIEVADGFALNVSNFVETQANIAYGLALSRLLGGKRFVIDTSRNGLGPGLDWCNPPGRALGERPTTNTGVEPLDALLWIKRPGESDGECLGGPRAGQWWADYALDLVRRARW